MPSCLGRRCRHRSHRPAVGRIEGRNSCPQCQDSVRIRSSSPSRWPGGREASVAQFDEAVASRPAGGRRSSPLPGTRSAPRRTGRHRTAPRGAPALRLPCWRVRTPRAPTPHRQRRSSSAAAAAWSRSGRTRRSCSPPAPGPADRSWDWTGPRSIPVASPRRGWRRGSVRRPSVAGACRRLIGGETLVDKLERPYQHSKYRCAN
jgi:hypothetical protein